MRHTSNAVARGCGRVDGTGVAMTRYEPMQGSSKCFVPRFREIQSNLVLFNRTLAIEWPPRPNPVLQLQTLLRVEFSSDEPRQQIKDAPAQDMKNALIALILLRYGC